MTSEREKMIEADAEKFIENECEVMDTVHAHKDSYKAGRRDSLVKDPLVLKLIATVKECQPDAEVLYEYVLTTGAKV